MKNLAKTLISAGISIAFMASGCSLESKTIVLHRGPDTGQKIDLSKMTVDGINASDMDYMGQDETGTMIFKYKGKEYKDYNHSILNY